MLPLGPCPEMSAMTQAMGLLSPAGNRARLSIFIFHRVLPVPDPLFPEEPDAARFSTLLGWIATWFNVIPLDDGVRRLSTGTLPPRAAAITFDDGYADNQSVALPILRNYGLCATFFVATGFVDGGCMWNDRIIAAVRHCSSPTLELSSVGLGRLSLSSASDRRRAIDGLLGHAKYLPMAARHDLATRIGDIAGVSGPTDLMMTSTQIRALRAAGMQIGAHTVSHPILARLSVDDARREILESKLWLEQVLQEQVVLFAYPNGKPGVDYLGEHARMVREQGFVAAVSTGWGAANRDTDGMQLPRFTPWDRSRGRFALRIAANMLRSPDAA